MPILTPDERIGTVLGGRYRIESILGQGGMGVVFEGAHELTGRKVAIKLLLPTYATDTDVVGRFFQEAKAAAGLNHPSVVDVLDMGHEGHDAFLVLEFLDGEPLDALLERRGKISVDELLPILLPVIDALGAAHERGIVHRDLKPENIYISRDLRGRKTPKVLDFGVAKLTEGDSSVETRTGGVVGTPQYMSPEQAQGMKDLGPTSDVWSMAVVIYESLCGARAFDAESIPALLLQICTFDPLPLEERAPDVPPAIAEVVRRGMSRDLARRYASMEQLGRALIDAAGSSGVELDPSLRSLFDEERMSRVPTPSSMTDPTADTMLPDGALDLAPARRSSNRLLLGGGIALFAAALLAGGWIYLRGSDADPPLLSGRIRPARPLVRWSRRWSPYSTSPRRSRRRPRRGSSSPRRSSPSPRGPTCSSMAKWSGRLPIDSSAKRARRSPSSCAAPGMKLKMRD